MVKIWVKSLYWVIIHFDRKHEINSKVCRQCSDLPFFYIIIKQPYPRNANSAFRKNFESIYRILAKWRTRDWRTRDRLFGAYAVNNWKKAPEFSFVEAYTNGVNAFIEQLKPADYPIEFKLLNYQPEPWTPLKTALFNKAMAEMLSRANEDIEMTNVRNLLGDSITADLYPQHYPNESPIIPNEVVFDFKSNSSSQITPPAIGLIEHKVYSKPPPQLGSNNWAVSGSKTASGYPILCNDPHLGLTLPSIWFELQINTPESNVYGVCLPGVPGIVIGFNETSAWGVTNVGHDVVDWYKIKWTDAKKEKYLVDGQEKSAELKIEAYEVKGQGTVYDTVRYTQWGPVVHQHADKLDQDLAMRWVAHNSAGNELKTFHGLNTSKDYSDYRTAITNFASPAQNIVYANKQGDISITVQGQLPIRTVEQGMTVQSGESTATDWSGFIPMDQLPHVKNPSRGFVSSANQRSTSAAYPYPYLSMHGGFEAYRGRTLNRKLDTMEQITVRDMQNLQTDVYGLKAAEALPALLALLDEAELNESERKYFDLLKNWNYEYERKASGPILFNTWFTNFYKKTWDEIFYSRFFQNRSESGRRFQNTQCHWGNLGTFLANDCRFWSRKTQSLRYLSWRAIWQSRQQKL